jgi:predicted O-methyltransferase YrrM
VADRFAERLPRPLRRVLARARPDVPPLTRPGRSARFRTASHDRFWWHQLRSTDYVPPLYAGLSRREWAVVQGWFAQTGRHGRMVAEINVPAMSLVTALIAGNGIRRVVQLGHHYGYSALLLGFTLRAMGARPGLFTIDIDPAACEFTRRWLAHAGLRDHVVVREGDSADPRPADDAAAVLGGPPELVLVDSSHAYSHTLAELDLWTPRLPVGGLVLLHDASEFATAFDPTAEGGVRRAIAEWLPDHPAMAGLTLNGHVAPGADGDALVYKDACGLGILQRVR